MPRATLPNIARDEEIAVSTIFVTLIKIRSSQATT